MKKLSELIEKFLIQITITVFFVTLILMVPFFTLNPPASFPLKLLSLRCLFLNALFLIPTLLLTTKEQKPIAAVPLAGSALSALYLLSGKSFLLPLIVSTTATAVISCALLAFSLIKVRFEK